MRTSIQVTLFLISSLGLVNASAFEITAVGGLNYGAPNQTTLGINQAQTGDAAFAFGLLAAIPLFDSAFDFESGVIYEAQQSDYQTVPVLTRSTNWTVIPFVVRYNFDENISIGGGGFTAFGSGTFNQTQNGLTTQITNNSLLLNTTDAGLIANIRARFAISPPFYFIIDARYLYGLKNLSQTTDVYNTRSVEAFAGVSYRFGTTGNSDGTTTTPAKAAPNPE